MSNRDDYMHVPPDAQLDSAAKAVGAIRNPPGVVSRVFGSHTAEVRTVWKLNGEHWQPRSKDADAMRLMAALHINVHCASGSVWATHRTADGYTICSESVRFHEVREITECYREAILDVAAQAGERGVRV